MSAIHRGLTFAEYRALPGIGITSLKSMGRSPLHFKYDLDHPKESKAMGLGTAAHCAILEPERFGEEVAIWTEGRRAGKVWDAWEAANAGLIQLKPAEAALVYGMRDAVQNYPAAMEYLVSGHAEAAMTWTDPETGHACRGRADWITEINGVPVLVGLKTARDCRHFPFASQSSKLGYHLQWAYYADGFFEITGQNPKVVEIVVESAAPHEPRVYVVSDDILDAGRVEYHRLLVQLTECERAGEYPPLVMNEEVLTLPTWVYGGEDEDLSDLGLTA